MTFTLKKINALFVFVLLLGVPFLSFAQESSLTLSVSPTIFDMTANPGQVWQSNVRIINTNPYDLNLFIDVADFVPKGESGVPRFIPLTESTNSASLAHWISAPQTLLVPAEKTLELPFTITLPADAPPGGHFAALMISTKPNGKTEGVSAVQTSQVITSLIFLRVSGDVTENSTVRSFRTTDYILSKPEATFELRIENKGNVHVQPQGEISIYNMWGQERGTITVNQQTLFGNVLPNSVRKYSFTWSGDWSPSDIGRYTAVATLGYGVDSKQFMHADTAFWIIPWKFLLLVFGVVGGFIALMTWAIKLYVRRMLALAGVQPLSPQVRMSTPAAPVPEQKVQSVTIPLTKGRRTKKQQLATVVAPIEVGILDLRARFSKTDTLKKMLLESIAFIKQYWRFFVAILAAILFIIITIWFVSEANAPKRDFEILVEGDGQSVKVSSQDEKPVEMPKEMASSTQDFSLSVLNRSGDVELLGKVVALLAKNGFVAPETSEGEGAPEERTVIVYDPRVAESALKLSKVLDNALLSSFTDTSTTTPQIVIYLGIETIQKVQ